MERRAQQMPATYCGRKSGNVLDPQSLRGIAGRFIILAFLTVLICNASPPILPLRLEPNAAGRIGAYINLAVSLTLAPLSEFSELLPNQSPSRAVIISSAAVDHPVREWPHYIAAKQAVEALGRVAVLQYPCIRTLIVRPQKLLTDLTNTPMGRLGAASPWLVASRIAARLEDPLEPEDGDSCLIEARCGSRGTTRRPGSPRRRSPPQYPDSVRQAP